jgi:hypothetical protein
VAAAGWRWPCWTALSRWSSRSGTRACCWAEARPSWAPPRSWCTTTRSRRRWRAWPSATAGCRSRLSTAPAAWCSSQRWWWSA